MQVVIRSGQIAELYFYSDLSFSCILFLDFQHFSNIRQQHKMHIIWECYLNLVYAYICKLYNVHTCNVYRGMEGISPEASTMCRYSVNKKIYPTLQNRFLKRKRKHENTPGKKSSVNMAMKRTGLKTWLLTNNGRELCQKHKVDCVHHTSG